MTKELNWYCSDYDPAVFLKKWSDGTWAMVGFWVDDATSVGYRDWLLQLEDMFQKRFRISGQNDAHWILGSGISCDFHSRHVYISQKYYIQDIAAKFNMLNSKPIQSPIPLGIDMTTLPYGNTDKEEMENVPYRELIGSLMFAATVS